MAEETGSVGVGADDLTPSTTPQRSPGGKVDRILDEPHGPIAEACVHSTGVIAPRSPVNLIIVGIVCAIPELVIRRNGVAVRAG